MPEVHRKGHTEARRPGDPLLCASAHKLPVAPSPGLERPGRAHAWRPAAIQAQLNAPQRGAEAAGNGAALRVTSSLSTPPVCTDPVRVPSPRARRSQAKRSSLERCTLQRCAALSCSLRASPAVSCAVRAAPASFRQVARSWFELPSRADYSFFDTARPPVGRNCMRPKIFQQHVSGGPAPRASGIGCAGASQS